jgi:hypothetical protein
MFEQKSSSCKSNSIKFNQIQSNSINFSQKTSNFSAKNLKPYVNVNGNANN